MTRPQRARKLLKIPEPVLEFQVYPEGRGGYRFTVKVFRTIGQMRKFLLYLRPGLKSIDICDVEAFTDQLSRSVLFSLYTCTDNCVAHEMFHATMWWAQQRGWLAADVTGWDALVHERCAEAHGNMVSQFWRQFSKTFPRQECWGFDKKKGKTPS